MSAARRGFTFIEVVACLLVVGLGVAAAVSLAVYGEVLSERAQGKATGMATALSLAIDPAPMLHQQAADKWKLAGASGVGTTTGWVNGYYVVRVETQGSQPSPRFASDPVQVDVYDGFRGHLVASYSTRIMKQGFSP
jgi:prepilin-type N-terminal cleavage/methylation domain-containing protein